MAVERDDDDDDEGDIMTTFCSTTLWNGRTITLTVRKDNDDDDDNNNIKGRRLGHNKQHQQRRHRLHYKTTTTTCVLIFVCLLSISLNAKSLGRIVLHHEEENKTIMNEDVVGVTSFDYNDMTTTKAQTTLDSHGNNKDKGDHDDDDRHPFTSSSRRKTLRRTTIPLDELTAIRRDNERSTAPTCDVDNNMVWVDNVVANHDNKNVSDDTSRIPLIIHQTAPTRCLYGKMAGYASLWRQEFSDRADYYLHDDEAVWRLLLEREWPEFPHLSQVVYCANSMTAISDLWRYLVLWEYGGIYADLDTIPNQKYNTTSISNLLMNHNDDDALFVVEYYGTPSQYFMAVRPKHPILFYTIQIACVKLMKLHEVGNVDTSLITGPYALWEGFLQFRGIASSSSFDGDLQEQQQQQVNYKQKYLPLEERRYYQFGDKEESMSTKTKQNRTTNVAFGVDYNPDHQISKQQQKQNLWSVRIVGKDRDDSDRIVIRDALGVPFKKTIYQKYMNMTYHGTLKRKWRKLNESCFDILWKYNNKEQQQEERLGGGGVRQRQHLRPSLLGALSAQYRTKPPLENMDMKANEKDLGHQHQQ